MTQKKEQCFLKMAYNRKPFKMKKYSAKGAWAGGSKVNV